MPGRQCITHRPAPAAWPRTDGRSAAEATIPLIHAAGALPGVFHLVQGAGAVPSPQQAERIHDAVDSVVIRSPLPDPIVHIAQFLFQQPPWLMAGGAVAALASNHLTYKQPSTVQRAQTYESYLSYAATNGLDALYVTGDNGYQQGQQVPLSDVIKGNPLISVSFNACPDENCTTPKPATLSASAWQSSSASKDVTNLLESIILQG